MFMSYEYQLVLIDCRIKTAASTAPLMTLTKKRQDGRNRLQVAWQCAPLHFGPLLDQDLPKFLSFVAAGT